MLSIANNCKTIRDPPHILISQRSIRLELFHFLTAHIYIYIYIYSPRKSVYYQIASYFYLYMYVIFLLSYKFHSSARTCRCAPSRYFVTWAFYPSPSPPPLHSRDDRVWETRSFAVLHFSYPVARRSECYPQYFLSNACFQIESNLFFN